MSILLQAGPMEDAPIPKVSEFQTMYLGHPYGEDEQSIALWKLAEEYHVRCETYDRSICTTCDPFGMALPTDGLQLHLINLHAASVLHELECRALALGFDWRELRHRISMCREDLLSRIQSE